MKQRVTIERTQVILDTVWNQFKSLKAKQNNLDITLMVLEAMETLESGKLAEAAFEEDFMARQSMH